MSATQAISPASERDVQLKTYAGADPSFFLEQGRNMVFGLRAQSHEYDWDQGSEEKAQGPGGALGYFLGGYVPPGTPNWHPILEKISAKIDTPIPRSRNGLIFYTPF